LSGGPMITAEKDGMRRRHSLPVETEIMGGPDKPGHDDQMGKVEKNGWRPNGDPERNSLWLLPSGPDQVGEASARRRSPRGDMADRARGGKGKEVAARLRALDAP